MEARADPLRMSELRRKFLERAKSYMGVPYAKRYHPPECKLMSLVKIREIY